MPRRKANTKISEGRKKLVFGRKHTKSMMDCTYHPISDSSPTCAYLTDVRVFAAHGWKSKQVSKLELYMLVIRTIVVAS